VPFATHGVEGLQACHYFLFGVVADRAGVEQYGIGLFDVGRGVVSGHLHYRSYHFAIGHVHLAAVSLDIYLAVGGGAARIIVFFHNL